VRVTQRNQVVRLSPDLLTTLRTGSPPVELSRAAEGVCLVLGAEGAGLSRLVRERCDLIVSIPMRGRLSSLNVSAAASLATYEVARHRK